MKILNENLEIKSNILKKMLELEQTINLLQAEQDELLETLKAEMASNQVKTIAADIVSVTLIPESTTTKFDSSKLKEDYPDIFEKYNNKVSSVKPKLRLTWKVAVKAEALNAEQLKTIID